MSYLFVILKCIAPGDIQRFVEENQKNERKLLLETVFFFSPNLYRFETARAAANFSINRTLPSDLTIVIRKIGSIDVVCPESHREKRCPNQRYCAGGSLKFPVSYAAFPISPITRFASPDDPGKEFEKLFSLHTPPSSPPPPPPTGNFLVGGSKLSKPSLVGRTLFYIRINTDQIIIPGSALNGLPAV